MLIQPATYNEYKQNREYRYSSDAKKYDPDMPIKSEINEEKWWNDRVVPGDYKIWAIKENAETIVGFISLFSFDAINNECEIGIIIFPKSNYNKGYGSQAVSFICEQVIPTLKIKKIRAEINRENITALKLFKKIGFIIVSEQKDGTVYWEILNKIIN